jgi:hypothetical protein
MSTKNYSTKRTKSTKNSKPTNCFYGFHQQKFVDLTSLVPIDPSYTGLSLVKLVEEDYLHLHFLSNMFLVICPFE